jgi:CheR methyltransferase, SAM binding domain
VHSAKSSGLLALTALFASFAFVEGHPPGKVGYITFAEAKPILEAMAEALPAGLSGQPPEKLESLWPAWVKSRDAEIRERLMGGDEDTIVNFLLFGTTFTHEPRLTSAQVRTLAGNSTETGGKEAADKFRQLVGRRIQDLVNGMAAPGNNERLLFARRVAERKGIGFADEAARKQAAKYVLENYLRVLKEQESFQQALAAARSLDDPTEEFAERSKLYRERGLSLDTALPPDFALEQALNEMSAHALVKPGSVKRVGIIGPGLDFTDKQEGYDFYPTQTVQPFAVMDSLLRLGLARAEELQVVTLDLSPRVNDHIERSRRGAVQGRGYTIQLPRDPSRGWKPELVAYWERFGDQIGSAARAVAVPASLQGTILRAVRIRPEFVRGMRALDLNVVLQREESPADAKFDLVIATNILVYYDTFEQSLALSNIQSMLRPGGFLLTNNLLLELPSSKMKSVDYVAVEYSSREFDGDRILWYRHEL